MFGTVQIGDFFRRRMLRVWYHVERDVVLLRHGSGLGLVPGDRPGLSPHRVVVCEWVWGMECRALAFIDS